MYILKGRETYHEAKTLKTSNSVILMTVYTIGSNLYIVT